MDWIIYIDTKNKTLYFIPIPMFGLKITLNKNKTFAIPKTSADIPMPKIKPAKDEIIKK
jgi:hypothetical protein